MTGEVKHKPLKTDNTIIADRVIKYYHHSRRLPDSDDEPLLYADMMFLRKNKNKLTKTVQKSLEEIPHWKWIDNFKETKYIIGVDAHLDELENFIITTGQLPCVKTSPKLYQWYLRARNNHIHLTVEQQQRLETISHHKTYQHKLTWEDRCNQLVNYVTENPVIHIIEIEDKKLREWAVKQTRCWATLHNEQQKMLLQIPFQLFTKKNREKIPRKITPPTYSTWYRNATKLAEHMETFGAPPTYINNKPLYTWWGKQNPSELTVKQQQILEEIPGFYYKHEKLIKENIMIGAL